jgi:hypothetical protein
MPDARAIALRCLPFDKKPNSLAQKAHLASD